MIKKAIVATFLLILSTVFLSKSLSSISASEEVNIEAKTVEYTLIYPGILPDHPLYFIKTIRDNIVYFLTRDYIKKAKLNLDFSDKKAAMALLLSQKGKWKLSTDTILDGEREFGKIPELLNISKKQGAAAPENFILILKLSNEKHREIIEQMLKDAPQGERRNFEEALTLNNKAQKTLSKL